MEESNDADMEDCSEDKTVFIPMRMEQLTREHDVHFYTGLNGTAAFNALFDLIVKKAAIMNYWKGEKNSKSKTNEKFEAYSKRLNVILSQPCGDTGSLRRGPPRKLTLEQVLLLTLMRLRLGLLLEDLAWRFNISAGTFLSHSTTLCSPPSVKTGRQMLSKEVKETSTIANVRIYVEQAIK